MPDLAHVKKLKTPTLIIVGGIVTLRNRLSWVIAADALG